MPRYAAFLRYPDGSTAIVHSSKPIRACICQAKISGFLCDYPVGTETCDAPLCEDCRSSQGAEIDYCPTHANEGDHHIEVDQPRQQAHVTDERGQEYLV